MTTYYERLGVTPGAAPEELRAAYRARARDLHPDRNGATSARAMADLNEAWRTLSDPSTRRDYDRRMGLGEWSYRPAPAAPSTTRPPTAPVGHYDDDDLWDPQGIDPRGRFLRWLVMVVVVLALLILLALFAYAFTASPDVVGGEAAASIGSGAGQQAADLAHRGR